LQGADRYKPFLAPPTHKSFSLLSLIPKREKQRERPQTFTHK
jgi:hypothetical protein